MTRMNLDGLKVAILVDDGFEQVDLRYLVRGPSLFAIPITTSRGHAAENAGAGDLRLTEAELARIDEVFPLRPRPRQIPTL